MTIANVKESILEVIQEWEYQRRQEAKDNPDESYYLGSCQALQGLSAYVESLPSDNESFTTLGEKLKKLDDLSGFTQELNDRLSRYGFGTDGNHEKFIKDLSNII